MLWYYCITRLASFLGLVVYELWSKEPKLSPWHDWYFLFVPVMMETVFFLYAISMFVVHLDRWTTWFFAR